METGGATAKVGCEDLWGIVLGCMEAGGSAKEIGRGLFHDRLPPRQAYVAVPASTGVRADALIVRADARDEVYFIRGDLDLRWPGLTHAPGSKSLRPCAYGHR